jgi:monoamine oxidase
MQNRRNFIRNTSLAAGALLLSSKGFGHFSIGKKPTVIIIGAGFAGLAAAYKLQQKKIDFVILEARNRIGGRVFSHVMDEKEKLVTELGAEWVGASHERLIALCGETGLTLEDNRFDTHLTFRNQYFKKGDWDYSGGWKTTFKKLTDDYHKMTATQKAALDKTDWWRYLVNNGCDGRDLDLRELFDSTDFGESIRHVSALGALAEYAESSEKNEMDFKIKGGNAMLAQKLADKLGLEKIKTGHAVSRIIQNNKGVTVHCANGTVFTGDKIICTAPAFAVSKINWQPGLPPQTVAALNELQYARINKNPLLFSKRFWADESFDMMTDMPGHYFYHATKNQSSQKGVLISYSIGDKADVISKQTDEWRANMIQTTLQPGFGDVKPLLEKQALYYWGDDAYSRGAYAMYGPGQLTRVMPQLQKDFMHTHFAGEHLADWQGFMEGAVNTGEAAAGKI